MKLENFRPRGKFHIAAKCTGVKKEYATLPSNHFPMVSLNDNAIALLSVGWLLSYLCPWTGLRAKNSIMIKYVHGLESAPGLIRYK